MALIAWFTVGYTSLANDDPAHYSAILEPSYRGLMLRKEYQSMAEFVDEAMEFYGPLGGKPKDDPVVFTFKSGAKIYTNHLGDKNAFEKYRGWGISRIGIEELTQIEDERWYKKLLGSLRAKKQLRFHNKKAFPALPSQILSTTNPDGQGAAWVRKRFVKVIGADGQYIPWNTPMKDPITKAMRIFIPMSRKENPYLRDNTEYESNLMAQDEVTRRQWMLGDWEAASGLFFSEFRPHGPVGADEQAKYPWARHVIDPVELKPWWYRFGGGDWGYDHPAIFHKNCRNERDGRIHCYEELSLRGCGSFELGVKLAEWWLPDLEFLPDKTVTIALSPDAFSKTDASRTKAEQMAEGIKKVLGPYGAFLLRYTDEERLLMQQDPTRASLMFDRRRGTPGAQFCLVLQPANTNRVDGWSYIRELLRFRPIVQETEAQLKQRLSKTFAQAGYDAYETELSKVKRKDSAALPKLQIWRRCREVIRCLEEAMKDDDHKSEDVKKFDAVEGVGGDDALDSCFIAGTMVETASGPKAIETIIPGDLVYTRCGLRPVTAAGKTRNMAKVMTLTMSDGTTLTGTPNHPVCTGSGFVRLDRLTYGDRVTLWQSVRQSYSTESNSDATRNPRVPIFAGTTGLGEITANVVSAPFIRKSGSPYMVPFRQIPTSTTRTKIPSITIPQIWSQSQRSFMFLNTRPSLRHVPGFARFNPWAWKRQKPGMRRRPGKYGMHSMPEALWQKYRSSRSRVRCVQKLSTQNGRPGQDFVLRAASSSGAEIPMRITGKRLANSVSLRLFQEQSTGGSAPAYVLHARPAGQASVYNLAVSGQPEYYANGILVHNCRHSMMSFKDIEKTMPKAYFISDRMEQIQAKQEEETGERITDQTRLVMIRQTQAARYEHLHAQPKNFTPSRASSSRHRRPAPGGR